MLEVPAELVEETGQTAQDAVEVLPVGFTLPFKVDLGSVRTWEACKEKA